MRIVGYRVMTQPPLEDPGYAYGYELAANGVWVSVKTEHILARIPVALCDVRGLTPIAGHVVLRHGLIPQRFFDLAMSVMLAHPESEKVVVIYWDGFAYQIKMPDQLSDVASVSFIPVPNTVFEMHSHALLKPFWSQQDDRDEQGCKIYGVVGNLDQMPRLLLRVGVYGYFQELKWSEVFSGQLFGAIEAKGNEDDLA